MKEVSETTRAFSEAQSRQLWEEYLRLSREQILQSQAAKDSFESWPMAAHLSWTHRTGLGK